MKKSADSVLPPPLPAAVNKIINPNLAIACGQRGELRGKYRAYIRFVAPEKRPTDIKLKELSIPGFFEGTICSSRMASLNADDNILSIELREHNSEAYYE